MTAGEPVTGRTSSNRTALPLIAGAVAIGLVVFGIVLIITSDDESTPSGPSTTVPTGSETGPTLPLDDTSQEAVEKLSGLEFPTGTADFLSARLDDGTQLDVTFTMPPADQAAFVTASGLPELESGQRVVTHSSPLWKLNPEGTISGAADTNGSVGRAVEVVPEGDRLRARVVITPAQ